jgi:mono/diheme cytochrome c family protein
MSMITPARFNTAIVVAALVLAAAGCERKPREIGARGPVAPPPDPVSANIAAPPGKANLAEVAPKVEVKVTLNPQDIFSRTCSACHQPTGQGIPAVFPPLDGSPYVLSGNVERMASIMLYGLIGPVTVKGQQFNGAMVGFGPTLSDEELAAVATHVRSSWSNKAEPVNPAVFAAMRTKWGSRGPFVIAELGEEK